VQIADDKKVQKRKKESNNRRGRRVWKYR